MSFQLAGFCGLHFELQWNFVVQTWRMALMEGTIYFFWYLFGCIICSWPRCSKMEQSVPSLWIMLVSKLFPVLSVCCKLIIHGLCDIVMAKVVLFCFYKCPSFVNLKCPRVWCTDDPLSSVRERLSLSRYEASLAAG